MKPQKRQVSATSCDRLRTPGEGLRVGEAIRLDRADIDWADGVLAIRESKFGKTRMVPVLDSTLDMLDCYARIRGRLCPQAAAVSA